MKGNMSISARVAALLAVFALSAFAGVRAPFEQFDRSSFHQGTRAEQDWMGAQLISLSVKGGTSVWLSNYVCNWIGSLYDPQPLLDLDGNTFQMGTKQYGYLRKSELQGIDPGSDYSGLIHWAKGGTATVTYEDPSQGPLAYNSTTAYYLDYFGEDDEIFFVMTTLPEDGAETVDSFQYVNDSTKLIEQYNPDTTLVSRLDNTDDLAGNVRINFGIGTNESNWIGREFVAIGSFGDFNGKIPVPSGQPLPGALFAGLLSLGTVLLSKRLRRSR